MQNQQIKGKLDALTSQFGNLQALQFANLAVGVVGVGVTVASTVILLRQIDRIRQSNERIEEKLDTVRDELRFQPVREATNTVRTCVERFEELKTRRDGQGTAHAMDENLDLAFGTLNAETARLIDLGLCDADTIRDLLTLMMLSAGTQIKVLLSIDELGTARHRAQRQFDAMSRLVWQFPRDRLARCIRRDDEQRTSALLTGLATLQASQPGLMKNIADQGISGRDYIARIENETEEPLLFLSAKPA